MNKSTVELVTVLAVALAPQIPLFAMANIVDWDEIIKGSAGVAIAGVVLGAYKIWKSNQIGRVRCPKCDIVSTVNYKPADTPTEQV